MASVVLGNSAGLAANVAAAVHFQKAAEFESAVATYIAASNFNKASEFLLLSRDENELALQISSVQAFCEVAVLMIIILAFAVVGVACACRVAYKLREVSSTSAAAAAGRVLQVLYVI